MAYTKQSYRHKIKQNIDGSAAKELRIQKAFKEVFDTPTGALERFVNSPEFKKNED